MLLFPHWTVIWLSLPFNIIISWHFLPLLSKLANIYIRQTIIPFGFTPGKHQSLIKPRPLSESSTHPSRQQPPIIQNWHEWKNTSEIVMYTLISTNPNPTAIYMSLTGYVPRHTLILFPQSNSLFINGKSNNPDIQMRYFTSSLHLISQVLQILLPMWFSHLFSPFQRTLS